MLKANNSLNFKVTIAVVKIFLLVNFNTQFGLQAHPQQRFSRLQLFI